MSSVVAETQDQVQHIEPRMDDARLAKPSDNADPAVIAGWWLHNERQEREISLADVALATRIEPAHLKALECGRIEELPERGRSLDIVWAYADHLKLEPGPLCAHFGKLLPKAEVKQLPEPQASIFKGTGILSRFAFPKIATGQMIGAVFASVIAFGGFTYLVLPGTSEPQTQAMVSDEIPIDQLITGSIPSADAKSNDDANKSAAVADKTLKVASNDQQLGDLTALIAKTASEPIAKPDASAKAPAKTKAAEKVKAPAAKKVEKVDQKIARVENTGGRLYGSKNKNSRLKIAAKARVWVRIEDQNGNVILNQTLRSGDAFMVPDKKGLVLIARDGGALTYELDGRSHGAIGKLGEILVGHPLDPKKIGKAG